MDLGWLETKTSVLEDDISDRAKTNLLSKLITVMQIGYFSLQILTRAAKGLSVSPLELSALSYGALAAVTWILQLQKPKSANTVIVLQELYPDDPLAQTISQQVFSLKHDQNVCDGRPGNRPHMNTFREAHVSKWVLALASASYGAIHLAGWNFVFPSTVDLWLWRTASIMATTSLAIPLLIISWANMLDSKAGNVLEALGGVLMCGESPTYLPARLVLIVEMVLCLFFLPPGAYKQTWTANLPGIGRDCGWDESLILLWRVSRRGRHRCTILISSTRHMSLQRMMLVLLSSIMTARFNSHWPIFS